MTDTKRANPAVAIILISLPRSGGVRAAMTGYVVMFKVSLNSTWGTVSSQA